MSIGNSIFFFKQKTAYEISACLVGSEMCIRDSCDTDREYRDRFVTYLVERKAEEYAVSAFSMPEKLLEALEEEKPDLAICGTGFEEMAERLAGYDIPVLVLQETMADAVAESVTYGSVPESCRGICRYQSMEVILHEVQGMTLTGAGLLYTSDAADD